MSFILRSWGRKDLRYSLAISIIFASLCNNKNTIVQGKQLGATKKQMYFATKQPLMDTRGRPLRDLRISVTDRCNFRCPYCMPTEVFNTKYAFLGRKHLLNFEEIARATCLLAELGVKKLRLSGGEPLLRRDLESLVELLAAVPGIEDIALTTNGSLLNSEKAKRLHAAGLKRVTVSLDSLDDKIFAACNGVATPVSQVLAGINNAAEAGLVPVKINMLVKRGLNDHSILDMARYCRQHGHVLRFIEYMDVGNVNAWQPKDVLSGRDIVDMISREAALEPVAKNYPGEVAQCWRYQEGGGEIGIITSVTSPFCHSCSRLRLSADGKLYTCLFATRGHDLKTRMRRGEDDETLKKFLSGIWTERVDRYSETRSRRVHVLKKVEMSYIGG